MDINRKSVNCRNYTVGYCKKSLNNTSAYTDPFQQLYKSGFCLSLNGSFASFHEDPV